MTRQGKHTGRQAATRPQPQRNPGVTPGALDVIVVRSLSDPVYSYEDETGKQYFWSVNAALELARTRNAVFTISLKDMGVTLEIVRKQYHGLDEAYALTTNLSLPLLFVPLGEKVWLIDGWHRLAKALLTGVDILPAYFLTQEEADACLLLTLSPGEGLDWGQNEARQDTVADGSCR